MKIEFTVNAKELVKELDILKTVVTAKSAIPILSNVRLMAADNKLELIGTDMQVSIISEIPANVVESGSFTLPLKNLLDAAKKAKDSITFTAELPNESNASVWAKLQINGAEISICGMQSEDFPIITTLGNDPVGIYQMINKPAEFAQNLEIVNAFSTKEQSRFELNAVAIEPGITGLRFISTDCHRLAIEQTADFVEFEHESQRRNFRLHSIAAKAIAKICKNPSLIGGYLTATAENFEFRTGTHTVLAKIKEGNFPNYRLIASKPVRFDAVINATQWLDAVSMAMQHADERTKSVSFQFYNGKAYFSAASSEESTFNMSLASECTETGASAISMNGSYLQNILKLCKSSDLYVAFSNAENSPISFQSCVNGSIFTFYVMPLALGRDELRNYCIVPASELIAPFEVWTAAKIESGKTLEVVEAIETPAETTANLSSEFVVLPSYQARYSRTEPSISQIAYDIEAIENTALTIHDRAEVLQFLRKKLAKIQSETVRTEKPETIARKPKTSLMMPSQIVNRMIEFYGLAKTYHCERLTGAAYNVIFDNDTGAIVENLGWETTLSKTRDFLRKRHGAQVWAYRQSRRIAKRTQNMMLAA